MFVMLPTANGPMYIRASSIVTVKGSVAVCRVPFGDGKPDRPLPPGYGSFSTPTPDTRPSERVSGSYVQYFTGEKAQTVFTNIDPSTVMVLIREASQ